METRVADVVAALVDVLDLEEVEEVDQADAADALDVVAARADVKGLALAVAEEDVVAVVRDALVDVKDVVDVLDVEVLVQPHVHLVVKVPPVLHAMVVPGVLVHVLHVHQDVEEVVVMDVADAPAVLDARDAEVVVETVQETVQAGVQAGVQETVVDVQDAVLDAMAHVLAHATGVVMDVVGNAKTHVQQLVQRHALEPVKLNRLAR